MTRTPPRHPTPVPLGLIVPGSVAAHVKAEVEASAPDLSPEMRQVVAVISVEVEQMIAEIHARHLAAGESIPLRVVRLEDARKEHDEKWERLTGVDERNGRMGRIEERIAATPAERAVEKSHHARFRWGVTKITAVLVLVGGLTVAWVRHYAGNVRDEYDAAIVKRTEEKAERASLMKDVDRLFALLGLKRTP